MDLRFSDDETAFRDSVRAWASANVPAARQPFEVDEHRRDFDTAWQRKQFDAGWAGIAWPAEYGGRGASLIEQMIFHEEMAAAGAPDIGACFVGVNHAGPTLMAKGTPEQKARHLPAILSGAQVWCQGFSEPGAGSDLASLRTAARIEGDRLVVNGQKIWTSYAHVADYCELLVRTDPTAPKHKGITWAILDMRAAGVEVRPIRTMLGHRHFCELFLTDVEIPLTSVVGDINDGWRTAMTTLGFERGTAFLARQVRLGAEIAELTELAKDNGTWQDDGVRRELQDLAARADSLKAMCYRVVNRAQAGSAPGAEGSVIRLYYSTLLNTATSLAMRVLGEDAPTRNRWSLEYLDAMRERIGAGTVDIQRNIIGERLLGLPR